jgi:hypothetical protein
MKAGEDLDERRLARAVLAEQAMDFALLDLEGRVIEGALAAKSLAEPGE